MKEKAKEKTGNQVSHTDHHHHTTIAIAITTSDEEDLDSKREIRDRLAAEAAIISTVESMMFDVRTQV